ncbi:MAG TPA: hypothetical protein VEB19_02185, partial [Gemmatimonadaceae bacterium]|nr:hypothetical protein [Gemmatimonadaceae bacterium]
QKWSAVVSSLGLRSRMDITDGSQPMMWDTGDFVLMDSSAQIIVRPAARTYTVISLAHQVSTEAADSLGIKMSLTDVQLSLDSLGAGEAIDGRPTLHYRMKMAFTLAVDAGIDEDMSTKSESTMDYWLVKLPESLGTRVDNDFLNRGKPPLPMMAELWTRLGTLMNSLPRDLTTVRSHASVRATNSMSSTVVEHKTNVSNISFGNVDTALFALPEDFRERKNEMLGDLSDGTGAAVAARWLAKRTP